MVRAQKVAVTGAAGTVGGFVVDLLREKGYRVIAIDRPTSRLPEPSDWLDVRRGDLTEHAFCDKCLEGADSVIHTAAVIDIGWSYEELKPINVDAVRHLYEAARRERAICFVHFSSGSIYDNPGGIIDESTPLKADSAYEQTKIDSEQVLTSFHGRGGPAYAILRPSLIYGPRGRLLGAGLVAVPPILRLFTGERVLGFSGGPRSNWVHAEDVARAAVWAMEHEACWGEAFNVADDTPLPIGDIVNAATKAYGLETGSVVPIPPKWVARAFYRWIDTDLFFEAINAPAGPLWAMVKTRYGLEDELTVKLDRATSGYFVKDVMFANEKLKGTGFTFRWPDIRTAFPDVLRWYQQSNWAPKLDPARDKDLPDAWGFEFDQLLRGTFSTTDKTLVDKPLRLHLTARAERVREFAVQNRAGLRGTITMSGFANEAPVEGTLEAALLTRGKFIYEFDFTADDGRRYHFRGVEDVEPANFVATMTTMEIQVTSAEDHLVARGVAKFDLRTDLLKMALSFRTLY